jgi:hypothetical protein
MAYPIDGCNDKITASKNCGGAKQVCGDGRILLKLVRTWTGDSGRRTYPFTHKKDPDEMVSAPSVW